MKTIAEKNVDKFGSNSLNLDLIAVQKDQDWKNEITWWIFEDGSAIGLNNDCVLINNNYGLSPDNEKLK
jgi:hypothetical protein